MVIKTLCIKIDRPTARKRALMDDALERYTQAFSQLMGDLRPAVQAQGTALTMNRCMKLITAGALAQLDTWGVQPFKDSLKLDAAMTLTAYGAHRQAGRHPAYPVSRLEDAQLRDAVNQLDTLYHPRLMGQQLDRLLDKYGRVRPLLFSRYAQNRDYCLLYDRDTGCFYAKLYLMNREQAAPSHAVRKDGRRYCNLVHVFKGFEPYHPQPKSRCVVLPLSFGKVQQQLLLQALKQPSMLRSAQLFRRKGEYYLHIRVQCQAVSEITPVACCAVTRSLQGAVGVGIYGMEDERRQYSEALALPPQGDALHQLSAQLVALAVQHRAQILMYQLSTRRDMLETCGQVVLQPGEYTRLGQLVDYKAQLAGLPPVTFVSANGIFSACPVCGRNTQKNRRSAKLFVCLTCGCSGAVEEIGRQNLALRLHQYRRNKVTFYVSVQNGMLIYKNKLIGFAFSCPMDAMAPQKFYQYLEGFLQAFKPENARQASVAKKLIDAKGLPDAVTFKE